VGGMGLVFCFFFFGGGEGLFYRDSSDSTQKNLLI